MKKYLLLFSAFLFFVSGFANNRIESKFSEISIIMKDGQVKSGKVKHPFDLNKKIVLISDSGEKVNIDNALVDEVTLKHDNGVTLKFKSVYFKNAFSDKISKKATLMMVVMQELLTVYYDNGISYSSLSMNGALSQTSYSSYYALREGEKVPTLISFSLSGQINANNVFKKSAAKYFEDYPELSKKIEDKVYKYNDVITVCIDYIKWKKSKN
jgi:hypothetical protein